MKRKIKKTAPTKHPQFKEATKKSVGAHAHVTEVLVRKRSEILNTVQRKGTDSALGEVGDELDFANQTFEREMMFELTNGERVVLDDIEAALRKIEKGDFGLCETCHKKIPSARLHAMPWARNCIECQSRTESQRV